MISVLEEIKTIVENGEMLGTNISTLYLKDFWKYETRLLNEGLI